MRTAVFEEQIPMYSKLFLGSTLILAAPLATAQEWDWSVTPYLWAIGIEGDAGLGPIQTDVSASFSELADVLAGAALVHVEVQNDDYGYFGDVAYMSLEPDPKTGNVGGQIETQLDTLIVEMGYLRKGSRAGLEFGIRYLDFDMELRPTTLPTVQRETDWVDGFVGVRTTYELNDKWNFTTRANIGAGGSDLTYNIGLTFGRELESGSQFVAGFKLLDIDYADASVDGIPFSLDTMFLGGTIGYMFD
jgi:hypothetical protein